MRQLNVLIANWTIIMELQNTFTGHYSVYLVKNNRFNIVTQKIGKLLDKHTFSTTLKKKYDIKR